MDEFLEYLKQKRLKVGMSIKGRPKIYLDVNYWLRLRNARRGQVGADFEFLEMVTELREKKEFLFPISEITFYEILKQGDPESRKITLELVDELSQGISIIDMRERVVLETKVWLLKASGQSVYDLDELVWTKLAFVLGYQPIMSLPTFSLQQQAFDKLESTRIAELTKDISMTFSYKDNIDEFNENFKRFAHENKSYDETFCSELGGFIDANSDAIKDVMDSMFYKESGRHTTLEERVLDRTPQVIYNAIRLGKVTTDLPLFHIVPSLYAWTRWTQKPFKDGNDTMDFYHASFALPYTKFFFTDRRLANAIKGRGLDHLYQCRVEHNIDDIKRAINGISQ